MRKFSIFNFQFSISSGGFTLTEMIVAITIFVLIVVSISSIHSLSQKSYRETEAMAEITQNGRVILERMTREIRQAKEMVTELGDTEAEATSTIEFEDGHIPSLCENLAPGSDHYYIRYYLNSQSKEVKRQCRVYVFDPFCATTTYYRWNATRETTPTTTNPCNLDDKTIGEYVDSLGFWGLSLINASTTLEKEGKSINLRTKVYGRNL